MKMVERMAAAMRASKAWPAVFQAGAAETLALAALRAMREPTHDMLVALSLPPRIGRSISYPDGWVSKEAFAAMIDVVLRESEAEQ